MAYEIIKYNNYLCHFNKNHSPKNGQFIEGDGDGDGIINDNAHRARTPKEQRKIDRKDARWVNRNYKRIYNKAYKSSKKEMKKYVKKELNKKYSKQLIAGNVSKSYINDYNKKLAEMMNQDIDDILAPSGRAIRFVARRGDLGVYIALADQDYDMNKVRNGVFDSGKVAYRREKVGMSQERR